jgi:hypothetical protein
MARVPVDPSPTAVQSSAGRSLQCTDVGSQHQRWSLLVLRLSISRLVSRPHFLSETDFAEGTVRLFTPGPERCLAARQRPTQSPDTAGGRQRLRERRQGRDVRALRGERLIGSCCSGAAALVVAAA